MTTTNTALQLITDLSRTLPTAERYRRLLTCIESQFSCDAISLLRLQNNHLTPLAILGLSDDTLGRHFDLEQQPRLQAIIDSGEPTRFAADSELIDPFDGLIGDDCQRLTVHDCLGVPLYIDDQLWGVLTLDSLDPHRFDQLSNDGLDTLVSIASATVKAVTLIEALEYRANTPHQLPTPQSLGHNDTEMVGSTPAMKRLQQEINTAAPSLLSVLILGETGVGKELVARQIHQHSERHQQPLIYVNCAALPESIAESELFGHSKGSFTGAISQRSGKFEIANGGTLFLDELGELPLSIQAKLLRAIQNGEIQRVGSDQLIKVDVRIITATNRDLKKEINEGRFRADLYHRLSVYPIVVPPLRERSKDILLLSGFLLEREQQHLGVKRLRLTNEAQTVLLSYDWPGNVRELKHLLSRAALRASHEQRGHSSIVSLTPEHLNITSSKNSPAPLTSPDTIGDQPNQANTQIIDFKQATDDFQRRLIAGKLDQHQNNMAATARSLQLDKSNFYRLLKRLNIHTND